MEKNNDIVKSVFKDGCEPDNNAFLNCWLKIISTNFSNRINDSHKKKAYNGTVKDGSSYEEGGNV